MRQFHCNKRIIRIQARRQRYGHHHLLYRHLDYPSDYFQPHSDSPGSAILAIAASNSLQSRPIREHRTGTTFRYSPFKLLSYDDLSCEYLHKNPNRHVCTPSCNSYLNYNLTGSFGKETTFQRNNLNCSKEMTSSLDEDFIHSVCCGMTSKSVTCSHFIPKVTIQYPQRTIVLLTAIMP
ncbi:hypothetical protein Mapa_005106 [Marchantia paleacea]|nr:hypothetical protein Mapa_005106 [Marchantia paleacea]